MFIEDTLSCFNSRFSASNQQLSRSKLYGLQSKNFTDLSHTRNV